MEALVVLALLIPIFIIIGAILGLVAFTRVNALQREVERLKGVVAQLMGPDSSRTEAAPLSQPLIKPTAPASTQQVQPSKAQADQINEVQPASAVPPAAVVKAVEPAVMKAPQAAPPSPIMTHVTQHWMVWLGGACVALAGVFLAKYSIEQGLLGPTARVAMGVVTGLGLHAAALWLRSKFGAHAALAALAGGGSITLFAALLAALHFYQMFSPLTVFGMLALVALGTMWLALQHGPVLAVIGMVGAYTVPIMVSTGSGNIVAAMAYALIISASILLLLRSVSTSRIWTGLLWWGLMGGGLFWWLVSLTSAQPDGWRGVYLALFAYGLLAFTQSNWSLTKSFVAGVWPFSKAPDDTGLPMQCKWLAPSLLLVVVAQVISVFWQGWQGQWLNWSGLALVILLASGRQPHYAALAWLLFVGEWLAVLLSNMGGVDTSVFLRSVDAEQVGSFFLFIFSLSAVFVVLAFRNLLLGQAKHWWAAMVAVVPVLSLLMCHLLGASFTADWQWALFAFLIGASYIALAVTGVQKQWAQELYIWLFLAGHFAYSIAVSVLFEQATLTLAIAVQLLSIAWIIRRFEVSHVGWLFKTVVVLVVVRLSVNPWLTDYSVEAHWPLWTYGGATVFCGVAARWLASQATALSRWAEAAALHLFALTLWAEARYWLYDGETFQASFTFGEATLNTLLFGSLALVYHYKAQVSERLARWYTAYSIIQLGIAVCNYVALVVAVLVNAHWSYSAIGTTPVLNSLLVAYGLPVVLSYFIYRVYCAQRPRAARVAAVFTAVAAFIFVCIEIRHLWQGSIRLDLSTGVGELYTYSIVWLLMAVGALLLGSWRLGKRCYQGGLVLLALVIVKIFLIDMAGLDGLLRVASFMGLGLALLAVAFLHQKLSPNLKLNEGLDEDLHASRED